MKDAASNGYYEVTLDLPIEIATSMNRPLFSSLIKQIKQLVPGSTVCIIEEEGYANDILYKVEISWR